MIRLLIFDSIAQLLLGSKYIADSGGKYPSCIGLHREEGMVKSGFCFLNLSTQTDLRGEKSWGGEQTLLPFVYLSELAPSSWQSLGILCAWAGLTWPHPFKNIWFDCTAKCFWKLGYYPWNRKIKKIWKAPLKSATQMKLVTSQRWQISGRQNKAIIDRWVGQADATLYTLPI